IHRDIKPANFFLAQTGGGQRVVKLLDFGVAKIKSEPTASPAETAGLTRTGSMLGSPLYMSPEQARGHRDLDQRSDIWSFGIVLYQALCGHTPRRDTDLLGELLILICTEAPEPLQQVAPWVAPELASLVHRTLRFNAGERFQTAGEMRLAISGLLAGDTTIQESMLQPLDPGVRASVAPLITASLHDAPAPRRSLGGSIAETSANGTTGPREGVSAYPPPPPASVPGGAPATRSASPLLIGMAGLALLLAGAAAAYVVARPTPDVTATTTTPRPSATPVAPSKTRTVRLVVIPADATVDVEGTPVIARDGLVEIRGALGSVHAVHVKAGDEETSTNVVVTEDGALPPKIELHPTAVKPIPGKMTPTSRVVPGPLPTAKPVASPPPSDFRTGR
ncbi:MAG: serine/threonine-protein kinase, partial [Byssovorax sp.]